MLADPPRCASDAGAATSTPRPVGSSADHRRRASRCGCERPARQPLLASISCSIRAWEIRTASCLQEQPFSSWHPHAGGHPVQDARSPRRQKGCRRPLISPRCPDGASPRPPVPIEHSPRALRAAIASAMDVVCHRASSSGWAYVADFRRGRTCGRCGRSLPAPRLPGAPTRRRSRPFSATATAGLVDRRRPCPGRQAVTVSPPGFRVRETCRSGIARSRRLARRRHCRPPQGACAPESADDRDAAVGPRGGGDDASAATSNPSVTALVFDRELRGVGMCHNAPSSMPDGQRDARRRLHHEPLSVPCLVH